jgi:hypothetical protein
MREGAMVTTLTERPQSMGDDAKMQANGGGAKANAKSRTEDPRAKAAGDAKAKAAAAAEAKQEKRQQWLDRADKEIVAAGEVEAQQDPEGIAKRLDAMVETARDAEVLEPQDKSGIRDRVRLVKRVMYERHVDHLLDCAMAATHDRAREQERNEILKNTQAKFAIAVRLGSGEDIREAVRARLGIIRETSPAGVSQKAKENAEREAQRREAVFPNERRTFARWCDPALVVVIAGRSYTTANWSLGGLLIEGFDGVPRQRGDEIEVRIGLDQAHLYTERVEVVRHDADERRLALKSRRFASVLLEIKRDCDVAGQAPA